MYNCSERKDSRAPMLCRTFLRGLVRQMGSPAVLAATYSNNTEQMASAAVNELQEALVRNGSSVRIVLTLLAAGLNAAS